MPLTATEIRNTKAGARPAKLFDSGGLFLLVNPNGSKWWRFKYRFDGKEKLLSLGVYPDVGLKEAREKRDEARKRVAAGIDPSLARKADKTARIERAANSFEVVAREWVAKFSKTWVALYTERVLHRLEKDVFPRIGGRPIAEIEPPELLQVVRRIEGRGALETARRMLSVCGQVFRYAVATGRAKSDPSRDLKGAIARAPVRHMASITDPAKVGELMRAIEGYSGYPVSHAALRLAPLFFVRPGELRRAEWLEFDLDAAMWTIPAARMKTRKQNSRDQVVPLSRQALEILRELNKLTGHGRYVFPSTRTRERPMSENTVNAALRRLGYTKDEMTGHGFRAMARTILDEHLNFRPEVIEQQLAHTVRDPQGRAYNRTTHLAERRKMMQGWADYLAALATGAAVVPIRKTG